MAPGRTYDGFVPGRHLIDAYGNGGFRFADMSHRGSILALPSGVRARPVAAGPGLNAHPPCPRAWPVASAQGLTADDLGLVLDPAEAVELLLLGTGLDVATVSPALRQRF